MLDLGCKPGSRSSASAATWKRPSTTSCRRRASTSRSTTCARTPRAWRSPDRRTRRASTLRAAAQGRAARLQHAVRQAGVRLRDPQGLRLRGASRVRGAGAHPLRAHRGGQALPARAERGVAPALLHALQAARDPLAQPVHARAVVRCTPRTRATAPSAPATWCACSTTRTRSR